MNAVDHVRCYSVLPCMSRDFALACRTENLADIHAMPLTYPARRLASVLATLAYPILRYIPTKVELGMLRACIGYFHVTEL